MSAAGGRLAARRSAEAEDESYFISMADLMVGVLFLFIILLTYFALQYRRTTDQLTSAQATRARALEDMAAYMRAHAVDVTVDPRAGILRLPEDILFDKSSSVLTPRGQNAVAVLGQAMHRVLPCYAASPVIPRPSTCPASAYGVDAVFIEGHTDDDPFRGEGGADNWDLSARRSVNTYRALSAADPQLQTLANASASGRPEPILSVSAYGPTRPIALGADEAAKSRNRRIDVRLIMAAPKAGG